MIKASELRIGSQIQYKDSEKENSKIKIATVRALYPSTLLISIDAKEEVVRYDECDGIPLTEEWLLKFGFKKWGRDDIPRTVTYQLGWINIFPAQKYFGFNGYGFMYYKENGKEYAHTVIQFFHQLQNLIFGLTREDIVEGYYIPNMQDGPATSN